MTVTHAVILGVVQGLSAFLPISSQAHLDIIQQLFHWNTGKTDLLFDLILHLGTLIALLAYFWREWYDLIKGNLKSGEFQAAEGSTEGSAPNRVMPLWPIFIACIPGALAGVFLEKKIESSSSLSSPLVIGCGMIVFGIFLWIADRTARHVKPMEQVTIKDWIIVGIAQALAVIPGLSRSGSTITAGLFMGLRREAAARFSFLLGAPVILGAILYMLLRHHSELHASNALPYGAGLVASAIVGYICIRDLIGYLKTRSYAIFTVYRIVFGVVVIVLYLAGKFH